MESNQDKIDQLLVKLEELLARQETFSKEVNAIKAQITQFSTTEKASVTLPTEEKAQEEKFSDFELIKRSGQEIIEGETSAGNKFAKFSITKGTEKYWAWFFVNGRFAITKDGASGFISKGKYEEGGAKLVVELGHNEGKAFTNALLIENLTGALEGIGSTVNETSTIPKPVTAKAEPKSKSSIEKYIGENLITVIGVAVTLIGVAIGAKYSIDRGLISPATRIILGYFLGLAFLGVGMKLKAKYEKFSATLVSGAMAIMYFITFAAYSYYQLIPKLGAFGIMVVFTIFTVIAAISYSRQVIALIGLVGSYAIPFLLSDGTGDIRTLFIYMVIINTGILVIAFKKYWKSLYYTSFFLTWAIYSAWYIFNYQQQDHLNTALIFLAAFFVMFYVTFLAYKLIRKELFVADDIVLIMLNSFIFYGFGYLILDAYSSGTMILGLFTLLTALTHFVASVIIYQQKLADRNLFYLISGMMLVFITIAVPVVLDGNWVTILWIGMATLLFWIGRTKNARVYEILSFPLLVLALFSLANDWDGAYNLVRMKNEFKIMEFIPGFNIYFLTSVFFIAGIWTMQRISSNEKYLGTSEFIKKNANTIVQLFSIVLLVVLYNSLRLEIALYWNQLYLNSTVEMNEIPGVNEYMIQIRDSDLLKYKYLWTINYTLLFTAVLAFINFKWIKNQVLNVLSLVLNIVSISVFLIVGLYILSELRESYIEQDQAEYYARTSFNLTMRYISYLFVAITLVTTFKFIQREELQNGFRVGFDFLLHGTILWILCSELINLMTIADSDQSYKLGLSILCGLYALLLIILGIWKKKVHLRIGAISLFGVTLLKLFLYDIRHLDTIAKTIVFVSLGILLLIISFLYNKYRNVISNDSEK